MTGGDSRRIILASTSPHRRMLLERLGIRFETAAPAYIEENLAGAAPEALVLRQAEGKARSLAGTFPGAIIIGADQVAAIGSEVLLKPGSFERAADQLRRLAGREHRLLTGLVLLDARSGQSLHHLDVTEIRLRPLGEDEIHRYLERDRPFDCAGSYKVESLGPNLLEYQRTTDPTAAIGLPLIALTRLLRTLGHDPL